MADAEMIPFTDAHTHTPPAPGILALRNLAYPEERAEHFSGELFSAGIHPRDVLKYDFEALESYLAEHGCAAVGECGLDRTAEADFAFQEACFLRHAELAEKRTLPLVIHCVRAYPELIRLKKKRKKTIPWIIHGFRGNAKTAHELLKHGFTLSLSPVLLRHAGSLSPEIMDVGFLLETDDAQEYIEELYAIAARLAGVAPEELKERVYRLFTRIFQYE